MENKIFEKEIEMCRVLYKKNGGKCSWGECEKCGVIPLLFKITKGKLYEKESAIKELKKSILEQ